MLLYPRKARDAAAALIKKNLRPEKLSRPQLQCLLAHGLHGELPDCMYEEAVAQCPANVVYFSPHKVKVPDLVLAIKGVRRIPKNMMPAVCFNKRALMATHDMDVLRALLAAGVVYAPEVADLVESGHIPAVLALTCAPWTASTRLRLSRTEIETVCRAIPPDSIADMIPKLRISPQDLVALADEGGIPPTNVALCDLEDAATCARLVCEWPYFNILKFLSVDMVRSREFSRAVREGAMELCVRPMGADHMVGISKSRSRRLPEEHVDFVYEEYDTADSLGSARSAGTSATSASASRSTHSGEGGDDDTSASGSLGSDESRDRVGPLARRFTFSSSMYSRASSIRSSSASVRLGARCLRMSEPVVCGAARVPRPMPACSAVDTAEELLCHLSDEWRQGRRARSATLRRVLEDFRLSATFPRQMLCSDAPVELKKKMLKVICGWTAVGEPSCAVTAAIECSTDQIMARLLVAHPRLNELLAALSKPPLPPLCGCGFCERQAAPGRSALRSASFGAGAAASAELDDAALLAAVADMTLLAMHGVVDPCFAGSSAWGPLSCALAGSRTLDERRMCDALRYEKLIFANFSADGVKDTNALVRVSHVKICDFVAEADLLNHAHARALIVTGCVAEYLLAAIFFRVTVLRRMCKIREFVAQVVSAATEATGTPATPIKVHDRVENEIRECVEAEDGVPHCTIGVVLRAVLSILESLSGDGGD
ncbi:hypothetical protein SB87_gp026 [Parapoxvirus red deer/HL953]|uniref:Uncharacterized protein n=1 Tax=Parapoxvirus red deer/HL953 TaxID=1579460 RepID=A0A0A7M9X0_9POXV|nr:hypothetical protein SB87_gp026 [Parapoxvirus red deer/HL953]AIZ77279.1 hypothetical protein [Parapoxvirus red deer/HL953]